MADQHSLEPHPLAGAMRESQAAPALQALEARLGYDFAERTLLVHALTHISHLPSDRSRVASYQRLEFLGDRVLGLVVSAMLYAAFPAAEEGELSKRLAQLVRKETCAEVAADWALATHLRLGDSEAQSGGHAKPAILADACEAVIGAVFLDGGLAPATALVTAAWEPRMRAPVRPLRDPKTALQEWAQGRGRPTPVYREIRREGPDHAPAFTVAVDVQGFDAEVGAGSSKRTAEQSAAAAFMTREGIPVAGPLA